MAPTSRSVRPRVETHPPYVASYGEQVAALMELARRPLYPHQRDAVELMTAVRDDGKWACTDFVELEPRQNGKGVPAEARVLAGLLLFGEELLLWSAHEVKTALEMFLRVTTCVRSLGEEINDHLYVVDGVRLKIIESNGKEGIHRLDPLPSGLGSPTARLRFVARSKGSGRGFSGDVNVIDEAYEFDDMQLEALQPTMRARPNPQTLYLSSPPIDVALADVLYRLRHRGDPTAPRVASDGPWEQDSALGYRDFGLGGDLEHLAGIDLDDRELWARTNPLYGIKITEEAMLRDRKNMSDAGFARECYGIWPRKVVEDDDGSTGVVDMVMWEGLALKPEQIERPAGVVFAAVVNAQRTQTVIAAVGPRRDGRLQANIVDVIAGTERVPARLAALRAEHNPPVIVVQDKGASATLLEPLAALGLKESAKRDEPRRGDVVCPWADEVAEAYGLIIDAWKQDKFRHVDDAPLNLSARQALTRPVGGGTAWDYKGENAAALNAVTLGVWGWLVARTRVKVRSVTLPSPLRR